MKVFILLCSFLVFWIGCGANGEDKIQKMERKRVDGLISFKSASYKSLGITSPRPYHLFVLFTAMSERYSCSVCRLIGPEFKLLAESYLATDDALKQSYDGKKVFFAVADFEDNQEAFNLHGFTSAPHLVYLGPKDDEQEGDLPKKMEFDAEQIYSVYQNGHDADHLAKFLKEKTRVDIKIYRSPLFMIFLCIVALVFCGLLIQFALTKYEILLVLLRKKILWMFVSVWFYGLSVSGMVYCIIREPLPYMTERSGKIKFFHPAGRQQFVFEGLIVGGYNIAAAAAIISLTVSVRSKSNITRYITLSCSLLAFIWAYYSLIASYTMKNPWYSQRHWY